MFWDSSDYGDNQETQTALAAQQQVINDLENELQYRRADRPPDETPPEQSAAAPASPKSAAPEPPSPATVLVFRDHHRAEVRNYAIMGDKLYEFADYHRKTIPLSDIDIPATVQANEEQGVEFRVPDKL